LISIYIFKFSAIIAISTDPGAPILEYAHYGNAGNMLEVLPALVKSLRSG
jgi:electron transfer flavoprotein alpha subunit